ncbi:c16857b1-1f24-49ce-b967-0893fc37298e [Sclerotinia trifoliorum]|uniref:C16857b1-1f24-49ce-b967-0893fc37298e n=1 Tax=Sclerotinia trifoliorum TaxID=28548 RepID=A0A8H2ZVE0_9HELO|nr:c16857b1-1f24-49ce-b967-0893fc37298e [Sclerotinia trifoliorum]
MDVKKQKVSFSGEDSRFEVTITRRHSITDKSSEATWWSNEESFASKSQITRRHSFIASQDLLSKAVLVRREESFGEKSQIPLLHLTIPPIQTHPLPKTRTEMESANLQEWTYKRTSLLGVPREIREIIYGYIFPSRFYLAPYCKAPQEISWKFDLDPILYAYGNRSSYDKMNLSFPNCQAFNASFLRVHPRIYQEARQLFWKRAIFVLPTPYRAIDALRSIAQDSIKHITHIELHVRSFDFHYWEFSGLCPAISMMNSLARHGQLQAINLVIEHVMLGFNIRDLLRSPVSERAHRFYGTLIFLCSLQTWRCQRGIKITGGSSYEEVLRNTPKNSPMSIQNLMYVVEKLHAAWGGIFYVGDTMAWKNGRHVYRVPYQAISESVAS